MKITFDNDTINFSNIRIGDSVSFKSYCPDTIHMNIVKTIDYNNKELVTESGRLVTDEMIVSHYRNGNIVQLRY